MPNNRCAGPRDRGAIVIKDVAAHQRGYRPLGDIKYGDDGCRDLARRPQDVGRARFAAAGIANVPSQPDVADDEPPRERAHDVANGDGNRVVDHDRESSSLRALNTSFIAVPSKSAASRIERSR